MRPLSLDDVAALQTAASESRDTYGFSVVPDRPGAAMRANVGRLPEAARCGGLSPFAIVLRGRVVGQASIEPRIWNRESDRAAAASIDQMPRRLEAPAAASAQRQHAAHRGELTSRDASSGGRCTPASSSRPTNVEIMAPRAAIERLGARFEGIRRADTPGVTQRCQALRTTRSPRPAARHQERSRRPSREMIVPAAPVVQMLGD